jgi:hypothetical protein
MLEKIKVMLGKTKGFLLKKPDATMGLTNQVIADTILETFKQSIPRASFNDRLLFDAYFTIQLSPNNYDSFKNYFITIFESTIENFYKEIRLRQKQFPKTGRISKSWKFSFVSMPEIKEGKVSLPFPEQEARVIGIHTGQNMHRESSAVVESSTVRVTVTSRITGMSETLDMDLNSLTGMEIIGEGIFTLPINTNWELTVEEKTKIANQRKDYATLEYARPGGIRDRYLMHEKEITIGRGKRDDSTKKEIFIEHDSVAENHLRIRYDNTRELFEIAAFAPTRLNEVALPESERFTPQWQLLPDNSTLLLGGFTGLTFRYGTGTERAGS